MREIKFRAWDEEEERFIYSDQSYEDHWFEFNNGPLKAFGLEETYGTIHEPPGQQSRELHEPQMFTGLLDKNGKEIWEGDVVEYVAHPKYLMPSFISPVLWNSERACFCYHDRNVESPFALTDELKTDVLGHMEVIGNVWEDSELLKVRDE
jgi:uncharacterized phage protein (TIGR01671 family)